MCHFITLIVRGELPDLAAVMKRHGRSATPIDNPSIRGILSADEAQFLTTSGHCDCGTVLAARSVEQYDPLKEAARLRRKGWSDAKIARSLRDSERADSRPTKHIDSFEFWNAVLEDVAAMPRIKGVGLLVHAYEGDVGNEEFQAARRDLSGGNFAEALANMREDELLFIAR